jgi:hypothetical protein
MHIRGQGARQTVARRVSCPFLHHHGRRCTNTRCLGSEHGGRDAQHPHPRRALSLHINGLFTRHSVPGYKRVLTYHALQDTEFPGVVARPIGTFKTSSDYHYQTMRCNVDLLKIIQIGITLSNEKGEFPEDVSTWQFNFHFSLKSVRATSHSFYGYPVF